KGSWPPISPGAAANPVPGFSLACTGDSLVPARKPATTIAQIAITKARTLRMDPPWETARLFLRFCFVLQKLIEIEVVFANHFRDIPGGMELEGERSTPGFGIGFGILDGQIVLQGVVIHAPDALGQMQIRTVGMPAAIEPGLVVKADGVHHQGVAFPVPNRIAEPRRTQSRVVLASVGIDLPDKVRELEQHDDAAGDL